MILGGQTTEKSNESFPMRNSDLATSSFSSNQSTSSTAVFDPFFGIKIISPRFSLDIFNSYCNELRKTKLSSLTSSSATKDSIVMGIIVETTGIRKSSNGKDYLIWHLSDMISDKKVKLLVFGDAAQSHWKLQSGFVIAVTNSEVADDNNQTTGVKLLALKVMKSLQIMSLGLCSDYGTCTGLKKNGERCTNYVNVSVSPVCVYHIQAEAKKLRSFRGALSAISNERPKSMMFKSPTKKPSSSNNQLVTVKRTNNLQSNNNVNLFTGSSISMASKAPLGHKIMTKLRQDQQNKAAISKLSSNQSQDLSLNNSSDQKSFNSPMLSQSSTNKSTTADNILRDFINRKSAQDQLESVKKSQQLKMSQHVGLKSALSQAKCVQPKPQFSLTEQAARKRAGEIFQRSQAAGPSSKKQKLQMDENKKQPSLANGKFTNDQIKALLGKKSVHEHEVNQVDREQELRYFQKREVEEKVETHATTLMEIKNVDVVTCRTCNYTTPHLAERCAELKHDYVKHKAAKRFFKCKDCNARTICYELMPTKPCTRCSCREFVRVAMKDERKVNEREKLLIRGEERKFVNI